MENLKESMENYLNMDGGIIFKIAIFNRFSSIGDSCYSDVCGSFIDGVYQWATHNINDVDDCKNNKYTGWTITFNDDCGCACGIQRRVYIPNWVMDITPKDWKHARNLFSKYLKEDVKFNNAYNA